MKFMHPNILYFLGLLIIPIIIHLFNFRRYKKLYFSNLDFIKNVEKQTNSTRNLRQYIILACRLLALAALILAFAQPYFPGKENTDVNEDVVPIYIDNSFSMSAKGSNGDLLNQAKAMVERIVENYPREQQYILVTNELSGAEHRLVSRSEVEDQLEYLDFSPLSRSVVTPLESVREYLHSKSITSSPHYYVISDFQTRNLQEKVAQIDTSAFYSFLQIEPQIKTNLYIDSVWFEQPFQRVNTNSKINIRIQNTGKEKLSNVDLELVIDGDKRQTLVDLLPNNATETSINYTHKTPGRKTAKVELNDKNVYFDNRFYLTYPVESSTKVLIINGEESVNYPALVFQTDDYYEVEEVNVNQLRSSSLNDKDLIVLNEINSISSGLQTQLTQLTESGVSLLIIPSKNYDTNSYNRILGEYHLPLLQGIRQDEIRIGKISHLTNFFLGMFDKKNEQIQMPPLKRALTSSTYTQANYTDLIQYENGMPLFVQEAQSQHVYMLYSPIHPDFNNFGKSALFSSLLLRVGEKSQGDQSLWLTIGSSDELKIRRSSNQQRESILMKQKEIEFIPEMTHHSNYIGISVRQSSDNQNINDGIYRLQQQGEEIGKLALNYNRDESDMEYASKAEMATYFQSLGVHYFDSQKVVDANDIEQIPLKNPNEYWRIFLLLSLLFFLIEMGIIIFFR